MLLSQRMNIPLTGRTPTGSAAGDALPEAPPYCATLVVVLESPHRCEFDQDGGAIVPKFPAMGATEDNLRQRLIEVLNSAEQLKAEVASHLPVRQFASYCATRFSSKRRSTPSIRGNCAGSVKRS